MVTRRQDGLQEIIDTIPEFAVIAKGTVNTSTGTQYPVIDIPRPSKIYRNLVLFLKNSTGQTISSITLTAKNTLNVFPNGWANGPIYGNFGSAVTTGAAMGYPSIPPMLFSVGDGRIQFNLAALTTAAGTIDYCLIGY